VVDAPVAALERLDARDPRIHAFVPEPGRAHRLRSTRVGSGPLGSMPVGVKDLYRVDGLPTRAGSLLPATAFEGEQSHVVTRLTGAGAVVLGKTAMHEFAYSEPPPTRNPLEPRRSPGGSSGGSAAAVAAGICPVAVGSQTLQSVLLPAAYCGVLGSTLTHGRLPFDGVALAPSIDTVGFLAGSIADLRRTFAAVVPDRSEPGPVARPVLGLPRPWGPPGDAADAWEALDEQVAHLRSRGFDVVPAGVPWAGSDAFPEWERRAIDLLHGEMARVHEPWFDRYRARYRPGTAAGVERGRRVPPARIEACREAQARLTDRLQTRMRREGIDAWICPAAPGVAPIGAQDAGTCWMTGFWSFAGMPAVSIPVVHDRESLPRGLQLVAPRGSDEALVGWAGLVLDGADRLVVERSPVHSGTAAANAGGRSADG
jgi:Asp-tRNA(Asn)/Glu-tRNA(Gln) amidotransferase A subunit family amidase